MNNFDDKIKAILAVLQKSDKTKLVCLSTTANINNPSFYIGSIRETKSTIGANFIFRNLDYLQAIIEFFDGKIDRFLIDCEVKNEVKNLSSQSILLIKKSNYSLYKPNDITIDALDGLIARLINDLTGLKVAVLGFGNLGGKIALKLAERGAEVYAFDNNKKRLETVVLGLNELKRGLGKINICDSTVEACGNARLVIGSTQGIPIIGLNEINVLSEQAIIIDAGNGTIEKEAIEQANNKGLKLLCLSPEAGYEGYWAALETIEKQLAKMKKRITKNNKNIIAVGMIGGRGDILVDDVDNPTKIIGICNGLGDILVSDDGDLKLEELK